MGLRHIDGEYKANLVPLLGMDEGRKRVLAIVAGILVARRLKTTDDLFDKPVESADRVIGRCCRSVGMRKIDNVVQIN